MEAIQEDAYILLNEKKISNIRELIPLLEKVAQLGKPLFIIAEDIEGESLGCFGDQPFAGRAQGLCCEGTWFGDRRKAMLQDIAVLTGGEVITEDLGIKLENIELAQLGQAKKIAVTKENTTIIEGLQEERHQGPLRADS